MERSKALTCVVCLQQMIMDKFDQVSESLDVGTMTMEQGMASSTSVATPIDEVDSLINQGNRVADGCNCMRPSLTRAQWRRRTGWK